MVSPLPAVAVIIFYRRSHTAPVNASKAAAAIVEAVDGLGVVVSILVLVLVPRARRHVGR